MTEDSITKFINTVSFFKGFSDAEKEKLINRPDCFEKFSKEDLIFKQGDSGNTLYLVLQGKVGLFRLGDTKVDGSRHADKKITTLDSGVIFGEISMLTESKRNVTARVESEQVVVMKITKKLIDSLNHPTQIKFHRQLLLALANHLDDMNSQFVDLQYKYDEDIKSKV